jgi:hypothetical protein
LQAPIVFAAAVPHVQHPSGAAPLGAEVTRRLSVPSSRARALPLSFDFPSRERSDPSAPRVPRDPPFARALPLAPGVKGPTIAAAATSEEGPCCAGHLLGRAANEAVPHSPATQRRGCASLASREGTLRRKEANAADRALASPTWGTNPTHPDARRWRGDRRTKESPPLTAAPATPVPSGASSSRSCRASPIFRRRWFRRKSALAEADADGIRPASFVLPGLLACFRAAAVLASALRSQPAVAAVIVAQVTAMQPSFELRCARSGSLRDSRTREPSYLILHSRRSSIGTW